MAGEGAYGPTHQAGQRLAVGRVCRPTGQNDFVHHGPWGWAAMAAEWGMMMEVDVAVVEVVMVVAWKVMK